MQQGSSGYVRVCREAGRRAQVCRVGAGWRERAWRRLFVALVASGRPLLLLCVSLGSCAEHEQPSPLSGHAIHGLEIVGLRWVDNEAPSAMLEVRIRNTGARLAPATLMERQLEIRDPCRRAIAAPRLGSGETGEIDVPSDASCREKGITVEAEGGVVRATASLTPMASGAQQSATQGAREALCFYSVGLGLEVLSVECTRLVPFEVRGRVRNIGSCTLPSVRVKCRASGSVRVLGHSLDRYFGRLPVGDAVEAGWHFVGTEEGLGTIEMEAVGSRRLAAATAAVAIHVGRRSEPDENPSIQSWARQRSQVVEGLEGGAWPTIMEAVAQRRVIGVGSPTHGTREYWDVAATLLTRLAREASLRLVLLERDLWVVRRAARFVEAGVRLPNDFVRGLRDDFWTREEVACLDAIADLNSTRASEQRVRVRGVDPCASDFREAATSLRSLVLQRWPADLEQRQRAVATIARLEDVGNLTGEELEEVVNGLRAIRTYLASSDARAPVESGSMIPDVVEDVSVLIHTMETCLEGPERSAMREQAMVDQALGALARLPARARCMFLGHNAHVGRENGYLPFTVGGGLSERVTGGYLALGTLLCDGTFVSRVPLRRFNPAAGCQKESFETGGYVHLRLQAPERGSIEAHLCGVNATVSYLGLDRLVQDGPEVARWLEEKQLMRMPGSTEDCEGATRLYQVRPRRAFDGFFLLHQSKPAQPVGRD